MIHDIDKNISWDGLWGKVSPHLANRTYFREFTELQALRSLLSDVKSFVDVGASFGPYTWLANYVLMNSDIIAGEANPKLCKHLEKEAEIIHASPETRHNKISIINQPLSNGLGTVTFEIDDNDYSVSKLAGTKSITEDERLTQVKLQTATLDGLFPDTPPDLVKLDIEGAEWRALDGARKILATGRTTFFVEIHPWGDASIGKTPSDVFKLFREAGYSVKRLNHHWLFSPERPDLINLTMSHLYGLASDSSLLRSLARRIMSK